MKNINKFRFISVFIGGIFLHTACSDEFLEITPVDQLTSETIFATETGADMFLADCYNHLPDMEGYLKGANFHQGGDGWIKGDVWENWSDNTTCRWNWGISWERTISRSYSPSTYRDGLYNHLYPAIPFFWEPNYVHIRRCNLFIRLVQEKSANFSDNWVKTRIAEARFIRAFHHHLLWMGYGGVPVVDKVLNIQEGDIFIPRSTSEETLKFITDELAACVLDLPDERGTGRATKGAALALKGWCELFGHKYAVAAATYKQIIDLGTYQLYGDYKSLFLGGIHNNNSESIFAYQHIAGSRNSERSQRFGPRGWHSDGNNGNGAPVQSLVDSYRMSNGLPITDAASGFNPDAPYDKRESRFYQSILYDDCTWAGKLYTLTNNELYNPDETIEKHTGYWRIKGIDETMIQATRNNEDVNYIFFRYGMVLLHYAEAKIELNEIDQSVIDAIDAVRVRGNIPTLEDTYNKSTFSQDELREIVRNELRVEMAFENYRYWDLIRWRIAHIVLNEPKYGMTYQNGKYIKRQIHSSEFDENKHYLFPIYQNWIDSNPAIRDQNGPDNWKDGQNPGY